MNENALMPIIHRLRWRLRLRDLVHYSQQMLWLGIMSACLVLVAGRIFPIEGYERLAFLPLAVWALAIVIYTQFRLFEPMHVVRRVEDELGLKQKLSSSMMVFSMEAEQLEVFQPTLVARLHENALKVAQAIDVRRDLPLRLERQSLLQAAVGLILLIGLVWVNNPMDQVLQEKQAIKEENKRQAEQVDRIREEIAKTEGMSAAERDALMKRLEELAQKLRANPGDREQALADLSQLEQELRAKIDPKAGQRQAMMQSLAAQLQAMAKSEAENPMDAAALEAALQQLAEEMNDKTPQERAEMAQKLASMAASAAQAGDAALSQAFSDLSQAMQNGDPSAASQAAKVASEAMQQAQARQADQEALNRALSQAQSSRRAVANAGPGGSQSAQNGQGQNGQGGQGNQPGQNGQGQGQGQGQQPGSGGGTNANTLPGATRTGQAGNPNGPAKPSIESPLDSQVYVPREQSAAGDNVVVMPGQYTDQGQTDSREAQDPNAGAINPALVPYQDVYQTYLDAAGQAMDTTYIPPEMKEYVKNYFSQLEP